MTLRFLRAAAFAVLALAFLALPAFARPVTEEEKTALGETIAAFDAAMRANDMATVISTLPPRMLEVMGAQYGVTVADLTEALITQMQEAMTAVTLVSFGMDIANATYAELSDGTPYALVPTETVMEIPDAGKIKAVSETLALIEEGKWYLLRVDPSQLPLLHQAYPGFAEVTFNPGSMEPVE